MIVELSDFVPIADIEQPKPKKSKAPVSKTASAKAKSYSDVKRGCIFLNVCTEQRSAASIAKEIWYKLSQPCYMDKWQQDIKLYGYAIKAGCHYSNRALR